MIDKILLNQLYLADYANETIEFIYNNRYNRTTVVHHPKIENNKKMFVILTDNKNNFIGYLNVVDGLIYKEINFTNEDYEFVYKDDDLEGISKGSIVKKGYINFEPLKNYNSKYIKPIMNRKLRTKALRDINKQIKMEKEKPKKLQKIA